MVRIKRTEDTTLIDELDRKCFPADERLSDASLYDAEWWVAVEDGAPVGYVGTLCGFLHRYGVLPEGRGLGLGKRLIATAYKHYARKGLPLDTYVTATNVPSLRAFLSCGWVITKATYDEFATYLHFSKGPK